MNDKNKSMDQLLVELKELRKQNRLNKALIENSKDMLYHMSLPDGVYEFVSSASSEIFGYTPEEFYASPQLIKDVIHPDWHEYFREQWENLVAGKMAPCYEYQIVHKSGVTRWLYQKNILICDKGGTPIAIEGIVSDITEQKRTKNILQTSQQSYQVLSRNMTSGYALHEIVTDDDSTPVDYIFLEINKAFEELTPLKKELLIGKKATEAIPGIGNDPADWIGKYGKVALTGIPISFEHYSEGLHKWFSVIAYMPEYGKFATIFDNITNRKKSEMEYKTIFQNAIDGFWIVSDNGHFIEVNDSYCKMIGYSREELLSMSISDIEVIETPEKTLQRIMKIVKDGHDRFKSKHRCKNGSIINVNISTTFIKEFNQFIVFVQDITDIINAEENLKKLQAQIQQAQKLESLGVLAGGVAHDFNNMLMSILGNADLALMDMAPESPIRDSILEIKSASLRASELTKQMLAYSGKGKFVVEAIDINSLIEEMWHMLEISISKKVVMKSVLHKDLPTVCADASQMRQLVMNMVVNASEAIGDNSGIITIYTGLIDATREYLNELRIDEVLSEGHYVFIEISDTGCGIDSIAQKKLYDPFFTTKFTGRGLGLSAVQGIVRGHNGTIKVYSEPEKGSTFKVFLPCPKLAPQATEKPAGIALKALNSKGTVLVVDDDEAVRTYICRLMGHLGYDVLSAVDGIDGVEVYREHKDVISLVLLDMTMPIMDGKAAFREMKKINPDAAIILTSGYNEQEATSHFVGKGLAGFIQKPFQIQTLTDKIGDVLNNE